MIFGIPCLKIEKMNGKLTSLKIYTNSQPTNKILLGYCALGFRLNVRVCNIAIQI
jgi:hypothetical protein